MKVFALLLLLLLLLSLASAVFAVRKDLNDDDDCVDALRNRSKATDCNFSAFDPQEEEAKVVDRCRATFAVVHLGGDESDLQRLRNESCNGYDGQMCLAFNLSASKANAPVDELTSAERVAVAMYTDQRSRFNRRHKAALDRNLWERYVIYSSLLQSAVTKLSTHYPTSPSKPLYYEEPKCSRPPRNNRIFCSKRIFWKSFMLLTLHYPGPKLFKLTALKFEPPLMTIHGGRIPIELSMVNSSTEVLIPPFEVFEIKGKDEHMFRLLHPLIQPFFPRPDNAKATVNDANRDQKNPVLGNSMKATDVRAEFSVWRPTSKETNVKAIATSAVNVLCSHSNWQAVVAVTAVVECVTISVR